MRIFKNRCKYCDSTADFMAITKDNDTIYMCADHKVFFDFAQKHKDTIFKLLYTK